jgi:hypothetical protein
MKISGNGLRQSPAGTCGTMRSEEPIFDGMACNLDLARRLTRHVPVGMEPEGIAVPGPGQPGGRAAHRMGQLLGWPGHPGTAGDERAPVHAAGRRQPVLRVLVHRADDGDLRRCSARADREPSSAGEAEVVQPVAVADPAGPWRSHRCAVHGRQARYRSRLSERLGEEHASVR